MFLSTVTIFCTFLVFFQVDSCPQGLLVVPCLLCNQTDSQSKADQSLVNSSQHYELSDAFSDSCRSYTAPSYVSVALLLAAAVQESLGVCVDPPHLPSDWYLPYLCHWGRAALPVALALGFTWFLCCYPVSLQLELHLSGAVSEV